MIIIKGNEQEILDRVSTHLYAQGMQCTSSHGCRYRGPNNTKCAIGCLIADEDYNPDLEGSGIRSQRSRFHFDSDRVFELCCCLQSVHDNYISRTMPWVDHLNIRLSNVAREFGLVFTPRGRVEEKEEGVVSCSQ